MFKEKIVGKIFSRSNRKLCFFWKICFLLKWYFFFIYPCISGNWSMNFRWGEIEFYLQRPILPPNLNIWAIFFLKRLFKIYSTQSLFCLICKWKPMIKIWISQAISDQSLKFWTFWISTRSQVLGTPIDLIPKCFSRLEIVNQKAYR